MWRLLDPGATRAHRYGRDKPRAAKIYDIQFVNSPKVYYCRRHYLPRRNAVHNGPTLQTIYFYYYCTVHAMEQLSMTAQNNRMLYGCTREVMLYICASRCPFCIRLSAKKPFRSRNILFSTLTYNVCSTQWCVYERAKGGGAKATGGFYP